VAEPTKRASLDLADALTGDAHFLGDLLEGVSLATVQAEAETEQALLSWGQSRTDEPTHVLPQLLVVQYLFQRWCLPVLDEIRELAVAFFADRHIQGQDTTAPALQAADATNAHSHFICQLLGSGPASEMGL
jgi:hypothetical protein